VRNVNNLPVGNLTVKPDPSDVQQESAFAPYYGGAAETKYAKNTVLTDRGVYAGNGTPSGLATSTPQNHPQFRMRRTGSRAEIDMLERETSSQIRVSPSRKTLNRISEYYHYFALKPDPFKGHNHNL